MVSFVAIVRKTFPFQLSDCPIYSFTGGFSKLDEMQATSVCFVRFCIIILKLAQYIYGISSLHVVDNSPLNHPNSVICTKNYTGTLDNRLNHFSRLVLSEKNI